MADRTPKAMILAAGFGTRLGELTQLRPKPMMPLCGAPLVRWSALWLARQGVKDLVINLHHLGEQIEANLGDGSELGLNIQYTHEEGMILGTGGGLRNARHLLDDGTGAPILVLNGKILFELELAELMATHERLGCEATMVMREDAEGVWGGKLAAGPDGKLATFLGSTREDSSPGTPLMFTGIHVFEPSFLDRVPAEGEQCIVRTAYKSLFEEGGGPGVHVTDGYWWEHSTPERYLAGMHAVLEGKVKLPHAEHDPRGVHASAQVAEGAELIEPVYVGPDAVIEAGAKVGPFAAIGAGAHIASGASVHESIVWPDAHCSGDWHQRVCTTPAPV